MLTSLSLPSVERHPCGDWWASHLHFSLFYSFMFLFFQDRVSSLAVLELAL